MMDASSNPKLYLAFRFHVNFYHSYRGDTPDELGFGPDIRIIRNTIRVLDEFNERGVPACGTWDIENYFSLETIMPRHCPDIVESWKRRVSEGKDEVQVMSYNNGLISAHTPMEFDEAIGRSVSNAAGSGLRDIFGTFAPVVRPQEMMYTPIHLKMYPRHGIRCISLFYSAVPFNAFSNFIPPLPLEQRFNPLTLTYPGIEETMTLLPACNHGDVSDNISLRRWVSRLRKKQLGLSTPADFLLIIDADADDEYWYGYDWPVVSKLLSATRGLRGLVENVADLDYIGFTTPGKYLETHPPVGEVAIDQDTADGSFDGFASWAEKWSNHQLWTGVERSRVLDLQVRRLLEFVKKKDERKDIDRLLGEALESRLKCMSTTHFGLSSPVMNVTRLKTGAGLALASVRAASRAFDIAADTAAKKVKRKEKDETVEFALLDYMRGVPTEAVSFHPKPSRALVGISFSSAGSMPAGIELTGPDGVRRLCAVRPMKPDDSQHRWELLFLERMNGGERKDFHLSLRGGASQESPAGIRASMNAGSLQNEFLSVEFDKRLQPVNLKFAGSSFSDGSFLRSAVTYAGETIEASEWRATESAVLANGVLAFERASTVLGIKGAREGVVIERELLLAAGLPYLYVRVRVHYPQTESSNYSKGRARKLQTRYDNNWREVMPCELRPALFGGPGKPLKVWKHNYCGHISSYRLNYGDFSPNTKLDSFNNHITHGWVAVSDGEKGLLVAQTAEVNSCFAFCPMRMKAESGRNRIFLNPFGSYHGEQFRYATASTGLGRWIALKMADHLNSLAPSYNGRTESFSLLIAPYAGDQPPEDVRNDAEAFAYPYAVVSRSDMMLPPEHRDWSFAGGIEGAEPQKGMEQ